MLNECDLKREKIIFMLNNNSSLFRLWSILWLIDWSHPFPFQYSTCFWSFNMKMCWTFECTKIIQHQNMLNGAYWLTKMCWFSYSIRKIVHSTFTPKRAYVQVNSQTWGKMLTTAENQLSSRTKWGLYSLLRGFVGLGVRSGFFENGGRKQRDNWKSGRASFPDLKAKISQKKNGRAPGNECFFRPWTWNCFHSVKKWTLLLITQTWVGPSSSRDPVIWPQIPRGRTFLLGVTMTWYSRLVFVRW